MSVCCVRQRELGKEGAQVFLCVCVWALWLSWNQSAVWLHFCLLPNPLCGTGCLCLLSHTAGKHQTLCCPADRISPSSFNNNCIILIIRRKKVNGQCHPNTSVLTWFFFFLSVKCWMVSWDSWNSKTFKQYGYVTFKCCRNANIQQTLTIPNNLPFV